MDQFKGGGSIWDNRSALHQAYFDYEETDIRLLHKVILKGTRPFGPAMPKSEFESQELLKLAKDYYRKKGVGRPTKKDRRDIDDLHYKNEEE